MREQIIYTRDINDELIKVYNMISSFLLKNDIVDVDGKVQWPCYVCIEMRQKEEQNHD